MKDENFYVVHGWMVNRLKLKGNKLAIYAIIYGFSQDQESTFTGSLKYMANCLSCSRTTVINSLSELCDEGFIEKKSDTKNGILFNSYRVVQKMDGGYKKNMGGGTEIVRGGSTEIAPNNKESIKDSSKVKETSELFPDLSKSKKTLFRESSVKKYEVFASFFTGQEFLNVDLNYYFNSVADWSDQKNMKRTAKGWIATARTWMREDYRKGNLKTSVVEEKSDYEEYLKMRENGN